MKLIVGLGNPGDKYKNNRHNVGYMAIDALLKRNLPKNSVVKKTSVFMNESGSFVKKLINHYSLDISHLYVVHDDLDIPLGSYKIQKGKGPKEHKGLNSINKALGTDEYWHVRIGVDNRGGDPTSRKASRGKEYVLQDFTPEERKILEVVLEKICKKLATY